MLKANTNDLSNDSYFIVAASKDSNFINRKESVLHAGVMQVGNKLISILLVNANTKEGITKAVQDSIVSKKQDIIENGQELAQQTKSSRKKYYKDSIILDYGWKNLYENVLQLTDNKNNHAAADKVILKTASIYIPSVKISEKNSLYLVSSLAP